MSSVKFYEREKSKGSITFYYIIYQNGKQRQKSFGTFKKSDPNLRKIRNKCKSVVAKYNADIKLNNHHDFSVLDKNISFIDYAESFIKSYSKKNIRMFISAKNHYITFLESQNIKKEQRIKHISESSLKLFIDYLKDNLNGETPHNYFSKFKSILESAVDDKYLSTNPARKLSIKRTNSKLKKEVLTIDELKTLVRTQCPNEEVKRAFLFSCFTGVGHAECKKLTWSNIKNKRLKYIRSKTPQEVNIPLSDEIIKLLGAQKKHSSHIFDLPSVNGTNKNIKSWVKKAKIDKHITFYCGRHTFAVNSLVHGKKANLKTVADSLGHTSTQHTVKYLNHVDKMKDKSILSIPSIGIE